MNEAGYIKINLEQKIKEKGMSKNKFANFTQMQRTQLNNYCKGNIQRVDLTILARICEVLDCPVGDILVYVPVEKNK